MHLKNEYERRESTQKKEFFVQKIHKSKISDVKYKPKHIKTYNTQLPRPMEYNFMFFSLPNYDR